MKYEEKISITNVLNEYATFLSLIDITKIKDFNDELVYKSCSTIRTTIEMLVNSNLVNYDDERISTKIAYLDSHIYSLYEKYAK